MPIHDELATVIRKARYLPELIPFIHAQDLAAGNNPIITLSGPTISTDLPVLTSQLSATPDAGVLLKLKADRQTMHEMETVSLGDMGELTPLEFLATRSLSLVLNADAPVTDYKMYLGIRVIRPSVAQRLLWDLPLNGDEGTLARTRGAADSVIKGVLPFPIAYQIQREYMGFKRTYAEIVANAVSGTTTPIITLAPLSGEFLVLESIAAEPVASDLADNTQLYVTRDDDRDYLKLPVFAMDRDYDLPCFIPALRKLEVNFYHQAAGALTNRYLRVVVGRYRMTDILRARFGMPAAAEVIEATLAGVVP